MSIDDEGFLGEQVDHAFKSIEIKHRLYLDLAYEINTYAQKRKYSYEVKNSEQHKLITNCLFMKILNAYQACIILLKKMLPYEATALSRTMCEPLYIIKILKDNPNFYKDYLNYSNYQAYKLINVALNNKHPIFNLVRETITDEMITELEEKLKGFNEKQFNIVNLATKANLKHHYDTMFRITSTEVHAPPVLVMRYIKCDENGNFAGLDWGPTDKDFDRIIVSIAGTLMWAIDFMDEIFDISKGEKSKEIKARWMTLDRMTQQ